MVEGRGNDERCVNVSTRHIVRMPCLCHMVRLPRMYYWLIEKLVGEQLRH